MIKARLIRAAGKIPGLSHLLRRAASGYAEGSVVAVRSGHAKGLLWPRHHRYVNGYWLGQYELEMQEAVVRLLAPGDTFIDLGANAGFFSLIAAKRVGPTGRCVSVEPDPAHYDNLRALIELNHFPNWSIVRKAVAEAPGKLRFADSQARIVGDDEAVPGAVEVDVTTVDALVREFGNPRLIKIDIEGAEVRALTGAAETIRAKGARFLIELHTEALAVEARSLLRAAGYRIETITGKPVPDDQPLGSHIVAQPA